MLNLFRDRQEQPRTADPAQNDAVEWTSEPDAPSDRGAAESPKGEGDLSPRDTSPRETSPRETSARDDGFWDLGEPRRKIYQPPVFAEGRDTPVVVTADVPEPDGDAPDPARLMSRREAIPPRPAEEKEAIPRRPADNLDVSRKGPAESPSVSDSPGQSTTIGKWDAWIQWRQQNQRPTRETAQRQANRAAASDSPYRTAQYRTARNLEADAAARKQQEAIAERNVPYSYDCENLLIRHVDVKLWGGNNLFYERFSAEAAAYHAMKGEKAPRVPFSNYCPQYAKLDEGQRAFYLYMRECIRRGEPIHAGASYLVLYIYEIINLPNLIPPEEGVELLCRIWLFYREMYPRLDAYLGEWLPDYCLIHRLPRPAALAPILPDLVRKAQFKEFYLDMPLPNGQVNGQIGRQIGSQIGREKIASFARNMVEYMSDYDFRQSRYYEKNRQLYEERIHRAVAEVLVDALEKRRAPFDFRKMYRLTRDSYCGAVAPAEIKRRVDVSFYTATRQLETRCYVTALVRCAENLLRKAIGIRGKLSGDETAEEDRRILERSFADLLPKAKEKPGEEAYLAQYEAADSGFDFDAAARIERASWANTSILTSATNAETNDAANITANAENNTKTTDEPNTATAITTNAKNNVETTDEPNAVTDITANAKNNAETTAETTMEADSKAGQTPFWEKKAEAAAENGREPVFSNNCSTSPTERSANEPMEHSDAPSGSALPRTEGENASSSAENGGKNASSFAESGGKNASSFAENGGKNPPDTRESDSLDVFLALQAALDGSFRRFCRENGRFEGEAAARVNEAALERMGDIVLEEADGHYHLIEEYREDVSNWLRETN